MAGSAYALVLLICPLWAAAGPGPGSILSGVKAASGGARWDAAGSLHFRGAEQVGALRGSFESWVDLQHGYWWNDERLAGAATGPVREVGGWNGKVSWSGDETGDVLWSESEEARAGAIGKSFIDAFGFLFPKRWAAALKPHPDQLLEGKRYIIVQAHPRGADAVELWVAETARRVERVRQMTGAAQSVTEYSDFRAVDGLTLPFGWREF